MSIKPLDCILLPGSDSSIVVNNFIINVCKCLFTFLVRYPLEISAKESVIQGLRKAFFAIENALDSPDFTNNLVSWKGTRFDTGGGQW